MDGVADDELVDGIVLESLFTWRMGGGILGWVILGGRIAHRRLGVREDRKSFWLRGSDGLRSELRHASFAHLRSSAPLTPLYGRGDRVDGTARLGASLQSGNNIQTPITQI